MLKDKKQTTTIVTTFVLGVIVALFAIHAYTVYQVRAITLDNQAKIVGIINFINQATGAVPPQGTENTPAE